MASILLLQSDCSTMVPDSVCSLGLELMLPQEAISTHSMKMEWEERTLAMGNAPAYRAGSRTLQITLRSVYTNPRRQWGKDALKISWCELKRWGDGWPVNLRTELKKKALGLCLFVLEQRMPRCLFSLMSHMLCGLLRACCPRRLLR